MYAVYCQTTEQERHLRFTEDRDYEASYHARASGGVRGLEASGIARQNIPKDMDPNLLCSVLGTALSDSSQLRLQPISSYSILEKMSTYQSV